MVQARENWAEVTGRILAVTPADRDGYEQLALLVEHAGDVGELPNFFRERVGSTVTLEMPSDAVQRAGLEAGSTLAARLRLATPSKAFAHPDLVRKTG